MTLFPKLSNFRFSPRHRRGLSRFGYGIPQGIICGVPVTCRDRKYERVTGLLIDDFARRMIDRSVAELADELAAVKSPIK